MSSSVHIANKKKDILIFSKNDAKLTVEKEYSRYFSKHFVLLEEDLFIC